MPWRLQRRAVCKNIQRASSSIDWDINFSDYGDSCSRLFVSDRKTFLASHPIWWDCYLKFGDRTVFGVVRYRYLALFRIKISILPEFAWAPTTVGDGGRATKKSVTFCDFSRFFQRNIFGIFSKIKWPTSEEKIDFGGRWGFGLRSLRQCPWESAPPPPLTFKNVPTPMRCCTCFRCFQSTPTSAPPRMFIELAILKFSRNFRRAFLFESTTLVICQLVKIPSRETHSGSFSIEKPNCKQNNLTIETTTIGYGRPAQAAFQ